MARMTDCPYCGKLTDPNLSNCPHCGGALASKGVVPQRVSLGRGRQTCPSCRALVQDGDIICVACGTNLLTGQKVTAEADAVETGRGLDLSGRTIAIVAGAALAASVVALWLFLVTRDPKTQAMRLIEDGAYVQAMDVLEEYAKEAPDDEAAQVTLGRLQYRNNRHAAAAASFEHALRLNPANIQAAYWALASTTHGGGDEDYSRRQEFLERIVALRERDAEAWYLLALIRGARGDAQGQLEALDRFRGAGGDEAIHDWNLGLAHAKEGDFAAASKLFEGMDGTPRAADAGAALGMIASSKGELVEASVSLEDVINAPGLTIEWEAQTELGKNYLARGDYLKATRAFDRALQLNSQNPTGRFLRGVASEALGKQQEALRDFEYLVNAGRAHAAQSAIEAARIHLRRNDPNRASDFLSRAARTGRLGAEYHSLHGRVAAANGNDREAERSFQRAIDARPGYAPVYLERGLLYIKQDRIHAGLKDLETYVRLIGNDSRGTRAREIHELTRQLRTTVEASDAVRRAVERSQG